MSDSPTPETEISIAWDILENDKDWYNWFTPTTAKQACVEALAFAREGGLKHENILKIMKTLEEREKRDKK
ncbi:hypothetical protein niasHS_001138 [Heterodera schachtii]|uniref:Uncharacterized protein n=2 Tax=Heterodera TaxID=34509 RepID=A0ABD2HUC4_9BILA